MLALNHSTELAPDGVRHLCKSCFENVVESNGGDPLDIPGHIKQAMR